MELSMAYSSSDLHGVLRFVAGAGGGVHGRFHISGAAVNHGFDGEDADGHFRELFFDEAETRRFVCRKLCALWNIWTAVISTCLEPPTHEAPSVKRPAFSTLNATICPRPISCSTFSFGTWQFSRNTGVVELPWMPILCSSLPGLQPGKAAFDDERGEFLAVHFREYDVEIRKAAVGDPHFLAVQDVVRAFLVQLGASQKILRIAAGLRFGKAIRSDEFSACELRQISFLLFFGAEINERERANAGMRAVRYGETAVNRDLFGQHSGRHFIEPCAAIFFRGSAAHQA